MSQDQDSIFDVVKSLPSTTHSVAIVTRSLSSDFQQPTKYMPDFGGVLEVPNSCLKNYSLSHRIPFNPRPSVSRIKTQNSEEPKRRVISNDCLVIREVHNSKRELQSNIIRAIGKDLHIDLFEFTVRNESRVYKTNSLALIPFINPISSIKFSYHLPDFLVIKFSRGVKTIRFNPIENDGRDWNRSAFRYVFSALESDSSVVKDSCLNHFNQSIQATASDNHNLCQIKFYDLGTYSRDPFSKITWNSGENEPLIIQSNTGFSKGKRIKICVSRELNSTTDRFGIQQLDNFPKHLVNLMVTTSNQICLADPRLPLIGQVFVDKNKIPGFYPVEFLKKTEFSRYNDYQFYSLSNVNVRVLDTRFPGSPLNQVCHMLDSNSYSNMNMKLINYPDSQLETLCLSSADRLSFLAFDQSQNSEFINPSSVHLPFHQSTISKSSQEKGLGGLFGLDVKSTVGDNLFDSLFSVFQLSMSGDICISDYARKTDQINDDWLDQAALDEEEDFNRTIQKSVKMYRLDSDTQSIRSKKNPNSQPEFNSFDVLDCDEEYYNKLTSKRAIDKFNRMVVTFNEIC